MTDRQRQAHETLSALRIFDVLAKYRPVLTGTVPLGLDVDSSDLDIVCEAQDRNSRSKSLPGRSRFTASAPTGI